MWRKVSFFLVFIFHQAFPSFSQEMKMDWFSVNEGLSQSLVHCFCQDKKGFIWIGTGDGLNRFDGYDFRTFKSGVNDSGAIIDNNIRHISSDQKGRLLLSTDKGISIFNPVTEKSDNRIAFLPHFLNCPCTPITDNDSTITFIVQSGGLYTYNFKACKLIKFLSLHSWAQSIAETHEGLWFCLHKDTVCFFNYSAGKTKKWSLNLHGENSILSLYLKPGKGQILVTTTNGIYEYRQKEDNFTLLAQEKGKQVNCMLQDTLGNYWVATENTGLCIYNHQWKQVRVLSDKDIPAALAYSCSLKHVRCLYEDNSGNVWIGTDGSGFCKITFHQIKFQHIIAPIVPLSSNFIKCLYQGNDSLLYTGTYNEGLDVLNRYNGKVTVFRYVPGKTSCIPSNTVLQIVPEDDGHLWIGTDGGLALFNKKENTFTAIPNSNKTHYSAGIVFKRRNGDILVLCDDTLEQLKNTKRGRFCFVQIPLKKQQKISGMHENKDSILYISYSLGGYGLVKGNDYANAVFYLKTAVINPCNCFCEDLQGNIWSGGRQGLTLSDKDYTVKRKYTVKDGLPDNMVYGILADNTGNLWISTNRGLTKFNPLSGNFRNFIPQDGLQAYEFNTGAYFKRFNGEMMFGGINGFNVFYPDSIKDNPHRPETVITGFKLFDRNYTADSCMSYKSVIKLNHDQDIITVEFAGLDYANSSLNKYAYQMQGIDTGWVYNGTHRFARYANLAPGKYTFFVKSCNNDGLWGASTSMSINIIPPFWQTTGYKFLICLLILFIVSSIVLLLSKQRFKKRLLYYERQQEIEKVRSRISKDIHDDLGAGLTKISLMSETLKKDISEEKETEEKLNKISSSARDMIKSLKEIVWSTNSAYDNLQSFLAYSMNYVGDFFEDTSINAHVDFPLEVPDISLTPEQRRSLFLFIKESLNNVLKHSHASEVYIHFHISPAKSFELSIMDNGRGFDTNNFGMFSNGIQSMKKRVEDIGGTFLVRNNKDGGVYVCAQGYFNI